MPPPTLRAVGSYGNNTLIGILRSSHPEEMRAIGMKMKLQEDVLIPPAPDILGDQAQVTESVALEVQSVISIDQGVEVQEFATVSFLNIDPDPDPDLDPDLGPVLHIVEISLEEVQSPIGQLAQRGHQENQ